MTASSPPKYALSLTSAMSLGSLGLTYICTFNPCPTYFGRCKYIVACSIDFSELCTKITIVLRFAYGSSDSSNNVLVNGNAPETARMRHSPTARTKTAIVNITVLSTFLI